MDTLIELVHVYGLWMIFVITLLQSLGLPLPAFAILMVTAAFTPLTLTDIVALIFTGSAGSLIGDFILYSAGKRYGTRILGRLCKISISPDSCVSGSSDLFERFGSPALTLAKFIPGLSTIAPLVAGVYRMRLSVFGIFSFIAAVVYLGSAVSLGVFFRNEISSIIAALSDYGKIGGLILAAAFGLYLLAKWIKRKRLIKQFNIDRVTVSDLYELIQEQSGPVILDARPADQRTRNGFIPGSILIGDKNLNEIAERFQRHNEVIIYCSCPNELTAARYAEKLRKVGLKRIGPLLGGIDEWAKSGGRVIFDHR
ncbi:hypothetical protein FPZ43_18570 [Mucilaginibacter pallidiroseus]|uniref:Rhodanese domain-containing protein n=1 Tax=Mucilaginibacter pallidiroseus TaxID=2599295 RepID=A0A563TYI1_9SPHI|nr:rhodanese-like domain-containing protein [Mucilaginibacter pallidiroseus]TWR24427.1 hypothetical protein FPZ43_18570 [Mucilaginibacter pallidiroseus]